MNRFAIRSLLLWLTLVVVAAGCNATPMPEPPSAAPPEVDSADVTSVVTTSNEEVVAAAISLRGRPGSAAPRSIVSVVNLDDLRPSTLTTAASDGELRARLHRPQQR